MAKAKDKESASLPSVGDVALRLLQSDSQIFMNYDHKWVAQRVKLLAQLIVDDAGEFSLEVAGLLAPRVFVFATSDGGEAAFKQSIDNMLEVVMIVREAVEKVVAEPVKEPVKDPVPPAPPASDAGAAGADGQAATPQA